MNNSDEMELKYEEKKEDTRFIILPGSNYIFIWYNIMFISSIYSILVTPLNAYFYQDFSELI